MIPALKLQDVYLLLYLVLNDLRRLVQRTRVAAHVAPANVNNLLDLEIPIGYSLYWRLAGGAERWLKVDSGPGNDRMLIFATDRNLDYLSRAEEWWMDGTFDKSPPLFQQLYTIHVRIYDSVQPVIWALLCRKDEAIYRELFTAIQELRRESNPRALMMDFEIAAANAFSEVKFINLYRYS